MYPDEFPYLRYAGIPRNMTGIAQVMKRGGYSTHMVGKWDGKLDHTSTPYITLAPYHPTPLCTPLRQSEWRRRSTRRLGAGTIQA